MFSPTRSFLTDEKVGSQEEKLNYAYRNHHHSSSSNFLQPAHAARSHGFLATI